MAYSNRSVDLFILEQFKTYFYLQYLAMSLLAKVFSVYSPTNNGHSKHPEYRLLAPSGLYSFTANALSNLDLLRFSTFHVALALIEVDFAFVSDILTSSTHIRPLSMINFFSLCT
jgi:hypothetical protein